MKTIPEYKFSNIEVCENGIKIKIIEPTADSKIACTKNVYISNEGINAIISRYFELNSRNESNDSPYQLLSSNDIIEDAVY